MERIDKFLASALGISRKDADALIRKSDVCVNGVPVKSPSEKADGETDVITVDGRRIEYSRFVYIMMNKPQGVVCSTDDKTCQTVIDLLPADMRRRGLFPAGRLDKDTTGFVLITDDGAFAHDILSPKKHIPKTYIATLDKPADGTLAEGFAKGVELKDEKCLPAELEIISGDGMTAQVVIRQGMYHQVRRMFAAYGIKVTALKRTKMGGLELDSKLGEGEYRYLTDEEVKNITNC
jgi:16S rRNA pseudouridine516 synthase